MTDMPLLKKRKSLLDYGDKVKAFKDNEGLFLGKDVMNALRKFQEDIDFLANNSDISIKQINYIEWKFKERFGVLSKK